MSIAHIEDLPLPAFIRAVQNIGTMHASEKLDGANLWAGRDDDGKFYTSREGKRSGSKKFYSEADYPHFAAYNGFRGAHAALEAKVEDFNRVIQPGQTVEIEVLYGRQPNAVTYGADGKSYIAFLRGVEGTPDVAADQLSASLGGQSAKVNVPIVDTSDGQELDLSNQDITFQFTGAQKIPAEKLKDVNLGDHLEKLQAFLAEPADIEGSAVTNGELITNSLATIPKDVRDQAKAKKIEVLAKVMTDFKLPIKKELLSNYVNKIKPALSALDVSSDEDVGIEGVVLRDPTTGDMIKLVDKDAFTTINTFNHAIRNQISGVVKTLDGQAPLESRGGILGNLKIQIADLLGNKELARGATAKKAFAAVKGKDPQATIRNFAANLSIEDFLGLKRKLLALISNGYKDMQALLADFKENKDKFQLKLKNGHVIGISPEIEKRTLLVFAESLRNTKELFDKINKAKSLPQVIATLYGHQALAASKEVEPEPAPVQESALLETKFDTDKARYGGKDAYTILNVYLATVLMSGMMYQADDKKGIRMLKDKTHYRLKSWSKDMSALNFWGYPVWHASTPAVKKLIGNKAAADIFKVARRVPANAANYVHMDLSFGRDVPIEWSDHLKTIKVLQQFQGLNTDRINMLVDGVFKYETLTHDEQVKLIGKLYFFVQQFIPTSPLFIRLKAIQNNLLVNANGENDEMVQEMKLLTAIANMAEDAQPGADSGTGPAPTNSQSSSETVTHTASRKDDGTTAINKSRQIVKKKRNPDVKKAQFPRPEKQETTE